MAWLGETFGDSLTSLKGQISKLTSEVLSEDPLGTSSFEGRINELENTCQALNAQIQRLEKENQELRNFDASDDQIKSICELEDQLTEITSERNSLKQSIEDIDSVHQRELQVVIDVRNRLLKKVEELENICLERSHVDSQLDLNNDIFREEIKQRDNTIKSITGELTKLKEQRDINKLNCEEKIENLEIEHSATIQQLNLLSSEIKDLHSEKNILTEEVAKLSGLLEKKENELQGLRITKSINGQDNFKLQVCHALSIDVERNSVEDVVSNAIADLKTELIEKNDALIKATHTIQNDNELIKKLQENNSDLETDLISQNLLVNSLGEDLTKLKHRLKIIENENNQLSIDLNNDKIKNEELCSANSVAMKELEYENMKLVNQLQQASDDLANCKRSLNELNLTHQELLERNLFLETIKKESCEAQAVYEVSVAVENEIKKMVDNLGVAVENPLDVINCLKLANDRLDKMISEQRERSIAVNDTLRSEIGKLKGVVGRIRSEFLRTPSDRLLDTDFTVGNSMESQNFSKSHSIESQTDDVKRLEQDVAQMTQIIKMIDDGLTAIYQDKSQLENELSNLQIVSSKTEKELLTNTNILEEMMNEKNKLEINMKQKDSDMQVLRIENKLVKEAFDDLKIESEKKYSLYEQENKEFNNTVCRLKVQLDETNSLVTLLKEKEAELLSQNSVQYNKIEELRNKAEKENEPTSTVEHVEEKQMVNSDSHVAGAALSNEYEKKTVSENELKELQDQLHRFLEENSDLKTLVQQLRETIFAMKSSVEDKRNDNEESVHQHRRSLSQVVCDTSVNVEGLRAELSKEHARYNLLLERHDALVEKEANLLREVERLRLHLISVEDHYAAEAVSTEQELNETRAKLAAAEEQLRSSSTVYKSANVRSTQHVESLQSQIRLISIQRDDLQSKLSASEDQIQKHTAALASLQMVLEQFQVDKEREQHAIQSNHDYQLELSNRRIGELTVEMTSLKEQLAEAKNGLKAALRLGEQLEIKSQRIATLEKTIEVRETKLLETTKNLDSINNIMSNKIDKSLVKNLVMGYLGASQGAHKMQALKILASVLELSVDERAKVGVDDQGGWLFNLLHPRGEASGESLSQAFIRFLESESRPQPQLKLLPKEPSLGEKAKRPQLLLTDLVLPTVSQTQISEPTDSVLSNVLEKS